MKIQASPGKITTRYQTATANLKTPTEVSSNDLIKQLLIDLPELVQQTHEMLDIFESGLFVSKYIEYKK